MKKFMAIVISLAIALSYFDSLGIVASAEDLIIIDNESYIKKGENLYMNSNFSDNSGEGMEQWYVGSNTNGNPTDATYQIPKINNDGTVENLTLLTDTGYLTTGAFEQTGNDTFYYGADGTRTYLVEQMSSSWKNCAWNGKHSLLSYVPIKENTNYTFSFKAFTVSGKASIRFGAIDMDEGENFYVPSSYSTNGSLKFVSSDYFDCKNNDQQTIGGAWTTYTLNFNSGEGADYFLFNAYWLQVASYLCVTDFKLYELAQASSVDINYVDFKGETIATEEVYVAEGIVLDFGETGFYLDGKVIKASVTTHTVTAEEIQADTINITAEATSEYAAIADTYAATDGVAHNNDTTYFVFAGSGGGNDATLRAPSRDSDGNATVVNGGALLYTQRVGLISFVKPSVAEDTAVTLNIGFATVNGNIGTASMKVAVMCFDGLVDEAAGYYNTEYAYNADKLVWSNEMCSGTEKGSMTFDVTEAVKNATGDYITFAFYVPTAGIYIIDTENAVRGGLYQGEVAYLTFEHGYTVNVTGADKITKGGSLIDGTKVVIPDGSTIKIYSETAVGFTDGKKVYKANEAVEITENSTLSGASLGVSVVPGAQVRFGGGVDSDGKVNEGNGLRFIGQINRSDSLVNVENSEYGLKITAEGSEVPVYIKAEKFQNEDAGVFTVALTNLAENNYNRNFTATPYVKVDGQEFLSENTITRSIYKVSAGLLKNGVTTAENGEEENIDYTVANNTLEAVLQAYVNQVGIRLTLEKDGTVSARVDGTGSYTGDVFFSVECVNNNDSTYTITVTPDESFNTKVEINPNWWTEYIRINNNNSVVRENISDVSIDENGILTFTFTTPVA